MNRRLKWMLAIAFLLVFAAGAMSGSFVGTQYFKKHRKKMLVVPPHGPAEGRMQEHLRQELELTPEQMEKVGPIIGDATAKLQAIRSETAARVRETMEEAGRGMAPHLTPEQQVKMAKLREQHQHHMKMRRMRHRGGHHERPAHEGRGN